MLLSAFLMIGILHAEEADKEEPLKEGDKAPPFALESDKSPKLLRLSDFQGQKLVLVFSRANWCPYCMQQVKDLQEHYDDIKAQNAEVLIVFREELTGIEGLNKIRSMTEAKMPLALDPGKEETGKYSSEGFHTYIIDRQGLILKILPGTKVDRPEPEAILAALR
jgi:peroxiredoxin